MEINTKLRSALTNVYVVAENRLLRETLVRLFRKRVDICIVGNTCRSASSIEDIVAAQSDLLLWDASRSEDQADDWLTEIRYSMPAIKVVLFGMEEDPGVFLQVVHRGIAGYVLKSAAATELLEAVRTVARGDAVCPPQFCKVLFETIANARNLEPARESSGASARPELTRRQRQLMSLVAKGLSNKEIAINLNLSEFTVKNHIYRIMKQVDAQNRHEAVELIQNVS